MLLLIDLFIIQSQINKFRDDLYYNFEKNLYSTPTQRPNNYTKKDKTITFIKQDEIIDVILDIFVFKIHV
jgi:hypothetical protein